MKSAPTSATRDETRSSCPVCATTAGSLKSTTVLNQTRDYITGDEFQIVQCATCHLAWTYPQPENLDRYYPAKYRRYNPIIINILKALYRVRVRGWSKRFSKPGSALEIGCGDGFMMDALRSLGWSVSGTERTNEMAEFARKHFGLTVYVMATNRPPILRNTI